MLYHRLLEALAQKGGPVCSLRNDATDRYLSGLLHVQVNDPGLRQSLIHSRGFCREHAWALSRAGDSLGIAILYKDQVAEAIRDLHLRVAGDQAPADRLFKRNVKYTYGANHGRRTQSLPEECHMGLLNGRGLSRTNGMCPMFGVRYRRINASVHLAVRSRSVPSATPCCARC
jgi:uncharacterized protein DUF6062